MGQLIYVMYNEIADNNHHIELIVEREPKEAQDSSSSI
jgi:hypothetical protein